MFCSNQLFSYYKHEHFLFWFPEPGAGGLYLKMLKFLNYGEAIYGRWRAFLKKTLDMFYILHDHFCID